MELTFSGDIWYWRGPAPYHFVSVPAPMCEQIQDIAHDVTYGWGMIPAAVRIGSTDWTTALWPKDGGYIVPIRTAVRRAERIDEGDEVEVRLSIGR